MVTGTAGYARFKTVVRSAGYTGFPRAGGTRDMVVPAQQLAGSQSPAPGTPSLLISISQHRLEGRLLFFSSANSARQASSIFPPP